MVVYRQVPQNPPGIEDMPAASRRATKIADSRKAVMPLRLSTPLTPRGSESLAVVAYDRIEDAIVHCRVAPGASLTTNALQDLVQLGRTPVHQAVRRLSAETLIRIRPRDGLQISPIDLQRDRRLLQLRREMDRFVAELATEKLDSNQRNRLLRLGTTMRQRQRAMDVHEFNIYDRQLDAVMLDAAAEPFLDRTLRPLHTIFRRVGHVHLTHLGGAKGLDKTIDCHLALLTAVVDRNTKGAKAASDILIDFAQSMFDSLEGNIDPTLLDAGQ
jgi:DNA-binding GntR family transcriptional regulator